MNKWLILAALTLPCGALAQGRLPSPALNNPTITGGTISGSNASDANVTATGGTTKTLGDWFQGIPGTWGTAAGADIGTSGTTIPLLSGANTWGAAQAFGSNLVSGSNFSITGGAFSGTLSGSPAWSGNHVFSGSGNGLIVTNGFTANNGLFTVTTNTNGALSIGSTTSAKTPFFDFLSTGTASSGFRIISTGNNNLTFLAGAATNVGAFSSSGFAAPISVNNAGVNNVLSGTSSNQWLSFNSNVSGTFTGSSAYNFLGTNTDTVDASAANQSRAPLILSVQSQFGGSGTRGSRLGIAANVTLSSLGTSDPANSGSTYIPIKAFNDMSGNAGGTSLLGGFTNGSAYALYPQVWLHPGATNFTIASGAEWDIIVEGTKRTLTVGTGNVSTDVITLTFTGASITGSPVAVTYTVGASNTQTNIVNGLAAAVSNNAALNAADISAQQDSTAPTHLIVSWPQQNTVTVAVSTTGTGSLSFNTAVTGASTLFRKGMSITRLGNDSSQGSVQDVALEIADGTTAFRSGQWQHGIHFGGSGAGGQMWPIAANGTMIGAGQQSIFTVAGLSGSLSPTAAKYGLDFHLVNFTQSGGSSLWLPGMALSGAGVLSLKDATFTTDTNGLQIDVPGVVGSGNPSIVSGGGGGAGSAINNYFVGDIVTDANGGQYLVATVNNSTGAVTGLTTLVQPSAASAWGTGLATTGGSGSGLTITPTAVSNNVLSLQPSGGSTTFGGVAKLKAYTVATLPSAATAGVGAMAYVTDATAPTYNGALTGGGTVGVPVSSDGVSWTSH